MQSSGQQYGSEVMQLQLVWNSNVVHHSTAYSSGLEQQKKVNCYAWMSWLLRIDSGWSVLFTFAGISNFFCLQCLPQLTVLHLDPGLKSIEPFRDVRVVIHVGIPDQA